MKAILVNTINGKPVQVQDTVNHPDCSYGKAVWVDKDNTAYCQVGVHTPFYRVIPLADHHSACHTSGGKIFVSGFGTWSEAEAFASEHGIQLSVFSRNPGQEWEEKGAAFHPFRIREAHFGMDSQPEFYTGADMADLEANFDAFLSGLDEDSDNYPAQVEELNSLKEKAMKALSGMEDSHLLLLFPDLSFRLELAEQLEMHSAEESWIIGAIVE